MDALPVFSGDIGPSLPRLYIWAYNHPLYTYVKQVKSTLGISPVFLLREARSGWMGILTRCSCRAASKNQTRHRTFAKSHVLLRNRPYYHKSVRKKGLKFCRRHWYLSR